MPDCLRSSAQWIRLVDERRDLPGFSESLRYSRVRLVRHRRAPYRAVPLCRSVQFIDLSQMIIAAVKLEQAPLCPKTDR